MNAGLEGFSAAAGMLPAWGFSARPQRSQKRAASGRSALQNGQFAKSQSPQCLQNLASARFSVRQLEQRCIFTNSVPLLYQIFSTRSEMPWNANVDGMASAVEESIEGQRIGAVCQDEAGRICIRLGRYASSSCFKVCKWCSFCFRM